MSLGDCLKPRRHSAYCGNGIVETGEQCDCGTTYTCDVHDKCCTPLSLHSGSAGGGRQACRLMSRVACSPRVMRCCTADCGVAAVGLVCRHGTDCSQQSLCDGRSPSCPPPRLHVNGTSCASGRGQCRAGQCSVSPCQLAGLDDCQCQSPLNHACSVCCRCPTAPREVCV